MVISEKIKVMLGRRGLTVTDFAKRLHLSRQSVTKKLKENSFTTKELQEISGILDCEIVVVFIDNGEKL